MWVNKCLILKLPCGNNASVDCNKRARRCRWINVLFPNKSGSYIMKKKPCAVTEAAENAIHWENRLAFQSLTAESQSNQQWGQWRVTPLLIIHAQSTFLMQTLKNWQNRFHQSAKPDIVRWWRICMLFYVLNILYTLHLKKKYIKECVFPFLFLFNLKAATWNFHSRWF